MDINIILALRLCTAGLSRVLHYMTPHWFSPDNASARAATPAHSAWSILIDQVGLTLLHTAGCVSTNTQQPRWLTRQKQLGMFHAVGGEVGDLLRCAGTSQGTGLRGVPVCAGATGCLPQLGITK